MVFKNVIVENKFSLRVKGLSVKTANQFLLKDISFSIMEGECWAFTGPTGSGKSTLLRAIKNYQSHPGRIAFSPEHAPKISFISHEHTFKNLSGVNQFYYQQRFNASDAADAIKVKEGLLSVANGEDLSYVVSLLHLENQLDQSVIQLSNGEHKRFQVAKALLEKSDWIILDNPYIGLDVSARQRLDAILSQLFESGVKLLLVSENNFPSFISHIASLENGILTSVRTRREFVNQSIASTTRQQVPFDSFPNSCHFEDFKMAVEMKNVFVKYNGREVLHNINWQVKKGERWNVSGHNGSGKSTLLSLITADNPQAFANDIYLFDKKRGSGETIWEIKKKIGFVSPELHHYFDRSISCFDVIASGFFDTIGLFRKISEQQKKDVLRILQIFKISAFERKPLGALSQGQQRIVLLARALVKNPPLLILDEPCQGLDDSLAKIFTGFVDDFCTNANKTLIYVTHVESRIPQTINNFLKLEQGRIIENNLENGKENNSDTRRWNRA